MCDGDQEALWWGGKKAGKVMEVPPPFSRRHGRGWGRVKTRNSLSSLGPTSCRPLLATCACHLAAPPGFQSPFTLQKELREPAGHRHGRGRRAFKY